jgi:hypothetical protein
LESYCDPQKVRYVKLLGRAVTDNFGTTGLSVARAKAQNGYAPFSPRDTVRRKRIQFLVASFSMSAATRLGFDVMRLTLADWHAAPLDICCTLSPIEVRKLRGTLDG